MQIDCLNRIGRAGWVESTPWSKKRAYYSLVTYNAIY